MRQTGNKPRAKLKSGAISAHGCRSFRYTQAANLHCAAGLSWVVLHPSGESSAEVVVVCCFGLGRVVVSGSSVARTVGPAGPNGADKGADKGNGGGSPKLRGLDSNPQGAFGPPLWQGFRETLRHPQ